MSIMRCLRKAINITNRAMTWLPGTLVVFLILFVKNTIKKVAIVWNTVSMQAICAYIGS